MAALDCNTATFSGLGHVLELSHRTPRGPESEPRQSLRTVVGDLHAGDFGQRAIRLSGVAHKSRGIPVDLIQKRAIRRDPVVARAAGDVAAEPPGRAIAPHLRARGILGDT